FQGVGAGFGAEDEIGAGFLEGLAEPGHQRLHGRGHAGRRRLPPQLVGEGVDRHPSRQRQHRQHDPLLGTPDRDDPPVDGHREGAEEADVQRGLVGVVHVGGSCAERTVRYRGAAGRRQRDESALVHSAFEQAGPRPCPGERTSPMDPTEMLALARRSVMSATERMAELLAAAPDSSVLAHRCEWSLREVAAHFITGAPMFVDMANGIPGPATSFEPGYVKDFCERRIADVTEDDPVKLSRLLLDGVEGFLDTTIDRPGDDPVTFQAGLPFTLFGLVGVFLGEVLLHGYDMATALGRPWPIDPVD